MSNIWKRIWLFLSLLLKWDPAEAEKRKGLKNIYRMLAVVSPPFIDFRTGQILPGFAKTIFLLATNLIRLDEVLRKTILNKDSKLSQLYNDYLIEAHLPEQERLKKAMFSYTELKERISSSLAPGTEGNKLMLEFTNYIHNFNPQATRIINETICELDRMIAVCRHNFGLFLAYFDPQCKLGTKNYSPRFSPVASENIAADLMDIYFILANFKVTQGIEQCFDDIIDRLKLPQGQAIKADIKKTLARIEKLREKYLDPGILLNLIRAIKQDPVFEAARDREKTDHVHKYTTRLTTQFRKDLDKVIRELSETAASSEMKALFGDDMLIMPEGYNEEEASVLYSQGITSFSHIKPLAILKNFFIYKFDEKTKTAMTKLIVEGFFDDKSFQNEFSAIYYLCEKSQEKILDFESLLMGNSRTSLSTIRTFIAGLKAGKKIGLEIDTIIEEINKKAMKIIEVETNHLNALSRNIAAILDDYKTKSPLLVSNIKVIGGNKNNEFFAALSDAYSSITHLIMLMQNFTIIKQDTKQKPLSEKQKEEN
jgi:hypothetical protein